MTDTITALLTILLNGEKAVPYNISNENSDVTIRDFARAVVNAFPERKIKLSFANPQDEAEPVETSGPLRKVPEILDNSRLKGLGWKPKISLDTGIKKSVATIEEAV